MRVMSSYSTCSLSHTRTRAHKPFQSLNFTGEKVQTLKHRRIHQKIHYIFSSHNEMYRPTCIVCILSTEYTHSPINMNIINMINANHNSHTPSSRYYTFRSHNLRRQFLFSADLLLLPPLFSTDWLPHFPFLFELLCCTAWFVHCTTIQFILAYVHK